MPSFADSIFSNPITGAALALPWLMLPLLVVVRGRRSPALTDVDGDVAEMASIPRVSVILPARNEAAHVAECVRSIRASAWPELEIIVVDDHSTDGTGDLARAAALGDARVRVFDAPPLPDGWFGKQWACHVGVRHASGSLLLFTDADTRHAADLVPRLVQLRAARGAELMSVAGRQEMRTIWEQAVQPVMFAAIVSRFALGRAMERARTARDVIANGQCFMLSKSVYQAIGGHETVRDFVAEDLMIAQTVWQYGHRVSMARGYDQLSTHMYDGLGPLVRGWGKNVYAGGRHLMRGGKIGRALFPVLLPLSPLLLVLPLAALLMAVVSWSGDASTVPLRDTPLFVYGMLASVGVLAGMAAINVSNRDPWYRAGLVPLGAGLSFVIFVLAVARGRNVRWKDRGYTSR